MTSSLVDRALLARQTDLLGSIPKFERISILSEAIQSMKDGPYEDTSYKSEPLYKIGDEVVVCSEFYYFAKIQSVRLDFECPDLGKLIPAYEVIYREWTAPELDREYVVEYDVLALSGPRYRPVELYMAHHWNRLKNWYRQSKMKKRGMFTLDADSYKQMEQELDGKFTSAFPGTNFRSFDKWLHQAEKTASNGPETAV